MMTTQIFDETKAEIFTERILGVAKFFFITDLNNLSSQIPKLNLSESKISP